MKRVTALVPTRNRAATAGRAISTFLNALQTAGAAADAYLVVVDDSDDAAEQALLAVLTEQIRAAHPEARLELLPADSSSGTQTLDTPGGGPGAARNRGLRHLRRSGADHDVLVMFDDDMVFADHVYRGVRLRCQGDVLLRQALEACAKIGTVAGCEYVGRQDLSILEHARLEDGACAEEQSVQPSLEREGVEHVAPGGISTAFLMVAGSATTLPDMPEHYNEDYLWLHALEARGRRLVRVRERLVHAPPGEVAVTAGDLSFQIFGEIVWLAVLERNRFPANDPRAMAAAVDEISRDLRCALGQETVRSRPEIAQTICLVEQQYSRAAASMLATGEDLLTRALVKAIQEGLRLCEAP